MAAQRTSDGPAAATTKLTGALLAALAAGIVLRRAGVAAEVIGQSQIVGIAYLAAGAIAWRRRPTNATGRILLATGCLWFLPDLQAASEPLIAAPAFAARRLVNVLSAYVVLAFPTGELGPRRHRVAMALMVAITAVQIPARLLLVDRIPAHLGQVDRVGVAGCDCPNPFVLADAPQLYVVIEGVTRHLSVAVALFVLALVIVRLKQATAPMRRVLWPVLAAAIVGMMAFVFNVGSQARPVDPQLVGALSWLLSIARAAIPIAFMVGLLRMQIDRVAVADLLVGLDGRRADALERAIVRALHDPQARLGYWSPAAGAYLDSSGRVLPLPDAGSGRSAIEVARGGNPLGVIVHDAALDEDKALLDAVSATFALAADRDRLAATVHAQATDARRLPGGPVTLLYADIENSTSMLNQLGGRYADLLAEERRLLRSIIHEHGGIEIDSRADEFFAAFADTGDPAGAALQIQRRLRDHTWPEGATVRVRIGLHCGKPQLTDEGYVGLDVHRATRIGSAGHGGQILLSAPARRVIEARLPQAASVHDLGEFVLKGLPLPESLSQLTVPDLPHSFPPLRVAAH